MRIALFTDIHGNRQALAACLEHAARQGAERHVFLGDIVGYGGDPAWCVAQVMREVAAGAVALQGNHDAAIAAGIAGLNGVAAAAIEWTRSILSPAARTFLAELPLLHEEEDRLYVHADASNPGAWRYVMDAEDARRSMDATSARITLCGHVHSPRLYGLSDTAKLTVFRPPANEPIPLLARRRWLAVLGAVGQPRDGDPAACYGLLDTTEPSLTWVRVPYDVAGAACAIRAAGLPEQLATRLALGR
ncbi:diadenosine tetraphosphatase ApaH/serine/threonine PP2A family protein phosphatase [Humitalea rosea]|uniref:Diadenosine tetraphosphatase ApaH/serine/threonine PP2A family protein phosphatase n=1 Tax=Humitalea rosea TaxID=990373 RepID=A0A2W7IL11_9PROT|nr:metallophosphoesterase family protein [Humitalea rosea]PZW40067.1 diadenosine tetraphosphatase ApaH/serine/threonine PP2A family protein phosphatase [Humitalea rosea]